MKERTLLGSLMVVACLIACNNENEKLNAITIVESQYQTTIENWVGDFAQYSDISVPDSTRKDSITRASLQIVLERAFLPVALDSTKYGLRMKSYNRDGNLFMFFKKKVTGFIPGRNYHVEFNIALGTPYFEKSVDSAGSTAMSVYLKAGASPNEPVKTLANGYYNFNLNKGVLSESGKEMIVLGNISNGLDIQKYRFVTHSNGNNPVSVQANARGEIWLCVGTESGYKGITNLYYDRIKAIITEQRSR